MNDLKMESIICGIDSAEEKVKVAQLMNGTFKGIRILKPKAVFQPKYNSVFRNMFVNEDGSGVLNGKHFRNIEEILHPEKYENSEMCYESEYQAFIDSIKIMVDSGSNYIETFKTMCGSCFYVFEDVGSNSIKIVIPYDVISTKSVPSLNGGGKKVFDRCNSSKNIYDSVEVIGGGPNFLSIDSLFENCKAKRLDVSKFSVESVINASRLFSSAYFEELSLEWLRCCKLENIYEMFNDFYMDSSVLDISPLDTSRIKIFDRMFQLAYVKGIEGAIDTSNATSTKEMFNNCFVTNVQDEHNVDLDLSWFDMSKVTEATGMFRNSGIRKLIVPWKDLSNLKNTDGMFSYCTIDEIVGIDEWEAKNLTYVNSMFYGAEIKETLKIKGTYPKLGAATRKLFMNAKIDNLDLTDIRLKHEIEKDMLSKSISENLDNGIFKNFKGTVTFNRNNRDSMLLHKQALICKDTGSNKLKISIISVKDERMLERVVESKNIDNKDKKHKVLACIITKPNLDVYAVFNTYDIDGNVIDVEEVLLEEVVDGQYNCDNYSCKLVNGNLSIEIEGYNYGGYWDLLDYMKSLGKDNLIIPNDCAGSKNHRGGEIDNANIEENTRAREDGFDIGDDDD